MKNRDIFNKDPLDNKLRNDGVARITSSHSDNEDATLRYELESFVCEGQYADGLTRILESVLKGLNSSSQPAVWVSGFYGSGKSHLVKMLHHLWTDTAFSDGATARGIAGLPDGVRDLLRELSTQGRRYGGLHAASGTLPSGGSKSVRMAVLGIICQSVGLPAGYASSPNNNSSAFGNRFESRMMRLVSTSLSAVVAINSTGVSTLSSTPVSCKARVDATARSTQCQLGGPSFTSGRFCHQKSSSA